MAQILLPFLHDPDLDQTTRKNLQILQKGLTFGEWVPTFVNVNTPDGNTRFAYQLCGKACFFSIYLQYIVTTPVWTATPSISLPFSAMTGPNASGLNSAVYDVNDFLAPATIGQAVQNFITYNKILLPVYAPGASKEINIQGFFWTKD